MSTIALERIWFLGAAVTVPVAHEDGEDGISLVVNHAPRGDSPPLHVHANEDEAFYVLDGELRLRVGDAESSVGAGEAALAPKGVPHTYRVESDEARWFVVTTRGDFERFVRAVGRPAAGDGLPEAAPPTPEQVEGVAAAAREHGIEIVGPPLG